MRIIDRYVLRLFLGAFAAIAGFMFGFFILLHALSHTRDLDRTREGFAEVGLGMLEGFARYYELHLPEIAVLFGPYALLFAGIYTLHHLGQGHELDSLHAVGVGKARICLPMFVVAALVATGLVALREAVIPGNARAMDAISAAMRGKDTDDRDFALRDGRRNVFIVRRWDSGARRLEGVWMDGPETGGTHLLPALTWDDARGRFAAEGPAAAIFDRLSDLRLVDVPKERKQLRRMSFRELRDEARRRHGSAEAAARMHEHVAFAFSPFVLLMAGLPMAMSSRRRNVFFRAGYGLTVALAFFVATQLGQRLGVQGDLAPPLAAWAPIVLFGLVGLALFRAGDRL